MTGTQGFFSARIAVKGFYFVFVFSTGFLSDGKGFLFWSGFSHGVFVRKGFSCTGFFSATLLCGLAKFNSVYESCALFLFDAFM